MNDNDLLFDSVVKGKPFFCVMQGQKFVGKSEMIKYIIYDYKEFFQYIVVFSASNTANQFYSEFLPEKWIFGSYNSEIIQNIITKQEAFLKSGKKIHCLIILDDILGMDGLSVHNPDPAMTRLFSANRHFNISLILASQSPRLIPPVARANADITLIWKSMNVALKVLYEEYSNMPRKQWDSFVQKYTQNHGIIMYNARAVNTQDTYSLLRVPESFIGKKFRLKY